MWWHPDLCSFASTRSRDYVLEEDFSYGARMPEINRRSKFSDLFRRLALSFDAGQFSTEPPMKLKWSPRFFCCWRDSLTLIQIGLCCPSFFRHETSQTFSQMQIGC